MDLINLKFGRLTVLLRAPNKNGRKYWDCHQLCCHKLYQTWADIIQRTTNPQNPAYKNYGGRDIKIAPEWRHDPAAFIHYCETLSGWDDPNLSIDRINNDGNYEPGNIRFTDYSVQNLNKRPHSNTGHKFISFNKKQKKFIVKKYINGKHQYFGCFDTLQNAIECKKKNNL